MFYPDITRINFKIDGKKRFATPKSTIVPTLLNEINEIFSRRDLGDNQIKELPPGVFNNNSKLIRL